jgi:UDP-3-O-[3-hydroxymyristoyl] glucosamine N-acyltransferase
VQVTVQQLAALVHGQVHGDGDRVIQAARSMGEAGPQDVTFVENERHARQLKSCRAGAVVISPALMPCVASGVEITPAYIRVSDPLEAFVAIVRHVHGHAEPKPHGIDPLASIHATARIGAETSIFPYAVIDEGAVLGARCRVHSGVVIGPRCRIGDDVTLYPHAVLYANTVLGHRVIVHANAVLGADGFGYRFQGGRHVKVPQFGWVEVGDDVEIGAGTTIDRGTFEATRIGEGTKIDNLVMIGHNCRIGRHNMLVSQVGIAGSCCTGDHVVIAGQAGVADHVRIGDRAQLGARSGLFRDVPAGERMLGAPATPEREQKRIFLSLERLPELIREVRQIKQHLGLDEEKGQRAEDRGQRTEDQGWTNGEKVA